MIEIMKENGFNANLVTPLSGKNLLLAIISFIDDKEFFFQMQIMILKVL